MKIATFSSLLLLFTVGLVFATDVKPLSTPDGAMIDTSQKATHAIIQAGLTNNTYGIRSTDHVITVAFFRLGFDVESFGKKGDRVWQVHQIDEGFVRVVAWVNAETALVKFLFPELKKAPTSDGIRQGERSAIIK